MHALAVVGIGVGVLMSGSGDGVVGQEAPEATVRSYLAAVGRGDVDEALSLLGPGFTLRLWDNTVLARRDEMRALMGWDVAAGGDVQIERVDTAGGTVSLVLEEQNAFTDLLDLGAFRLETKFEVADGRIAGQQMRELVEPGDPSYTEQFTEALAPVLEWGQERVPELVPPGVAEGSIRYDRETATALLELIRRYHERDAG